MSFLDSFQSWLSTRGYSSATIRNYLLDINKYLEFINQNRSSATTPLTNILPEHLSTDNLNLYIDHLSHNSNTKRYLASLKIFCQFAVDQHLITSNPIIKIRKQIRRKSSANPIKELRKQKNDFAQYLEKRKHSSTTIKNYVNDLEQYINWLETTNLGSQ